MFHFPTDVAPQFLQIEGFCTPFKNQVCAIRVQILTHAPCNTRHGLLPFDNTFLPIKAHGLPALIYSYRDDLGLGGGFNCLAFGN